MPCLSEFQDSFARAVLGIGGGELAPWLQPAGKAARDGLDVYRASLAANYRAALAEVYPVVERIVGEEFFGLAAHLYVHRHPSHSGDIQDFGEDFPAFLASFPPAAGLAYLRDIARLEWAVHRVFHAAEVDLADAPALVGLGVEQCASLVLDLAPSCRLLASMHPVHRLWAMHQPGARWDEGFRLDAEGARLLVRRNPLFEVECIPLGCAEFAFLEFLSRGRPLGEAFERVAAGAVELAAHLQSHLRAGTLVPRPAGVTKS